MKSRTSMRCTPFDSALILGLMEKKPLQCTTKANTLTYAIYQFLEYKCVDLNNNKIFKEELKKEYNKKTDQIKPEIVTLILEDEVLKKLKEKIIKNDNTLTKPRISFMIRTALEFASKKLNVQPSLDEVCDLSAKKIELIQIILNVQNYEKILEISRIISEM